MEGVHGAVGAITSKRPQETSEMGETDHSWHSERSTEINETEIKSPEDALSCHQ